jgi:hypothetical protein
MFDGSLTKLRGFYSFGKRAIYVMRHVTLPSRTFGDSITLICQLDTLRGPQHQMVGTMPCIFYAVLVSQSIKIYMIVFLPKHLLNKTKFPHSSIWSLSVWIIFGATSIKQEDTTEFQFMFVAVLTD